jgi:hypothetical protein
MFASSVALAAIVAFWGGEMLMLIPMLPNYFDPSADPIPLAILAGLVVTTLCIVFAVYAFNRKQF